MNNYEKWVGGELSPSTPNKSAFYSPTPKTPYNPHPSVAENEAKLAKIDKQLADAKNNPHDNWLPVSGSYSLIYQTENRMGDTAAPDMLHGNESQEKIESYGFMKPFKQVEYTSPRDGMTQSSEDQFSLPSSEHFKRMRDLANYFSSSWIGTPTSGVFSRMVDKFESNEGGYYASPLLDDALQSHETTQAFHKALLQCLSENINDGKLSKNIADITSQYMIDNRLMLPQFNSIEDRINGLTLTVHGIWSMNIYVEDLEYKGDMVRGKFRYEIEDHFGLDPNDVNHTFSDGLFKQFEHLQGFRSWYVLQHFNCFNYRPFITSIRFKL